MRGGGGIMAGGGGMSEIGSVRVMMEVSSHAPMYPNHADTGWNHPRDLTEEDRERIREMNHSIMMSRIRNNDRNMSTRLDRRRKAIRGKWRERGRAALFVIAGMVVVPLVGSAIGLAWNAFWLTVL